MFSCVDLLFEDSNTVVYPEFSKHKKISITVLFLNAGPACTDEDMFYFLGFPLDKAVEYAKLRNPLLINDLNMQYFIQDRYVWAHMHSWRLSQCKNVTSWF